MIAGLINNQTVNQRAFQMKIWMGLIKLGCLNKSTKEPLVYLIHSVKVLIQVEKSHNSLDNLIPANQQLPSPNSSNNNL